MGFLEKLFGTENKLPEQEAPKAVQSAAVPEKPVPFGYKVEWLCVKSESPQQVISALGLTDPQKSGWSKGLIAAHSGNVFVSRRWTVMCWRWATAADMALFLSRENDWTRSASCSRRFSILQATARWTTTVGQSMKTAFR